MSSIHYTPLRRHLTEIQRSCSEDKWWPYFKFSYSSFHSLHNMSVYSFPTISTGCLSIFLSVLWCQIGRSGWCILVWRSGVAALFFFVAAAELSAGRLGRYTYKDNETGVCHTELSCHTCWGKTSVIRLCMLYMRSHAAGLRFTLKSDYSEYQVFHFTH